MVQEAIDEVPALIEFASHDHLTKDNVIEAIRINPEYIKFCPPELVDKNILREISNKGFDISEISPEAREALLHNFIESEKIGQ